MTLCGDILRNAETDPNFLDNVIACGESWFFTYHPEAKCQLMHWKSTKTEKGLTDKMIVAGTDIVFLDIKGISHVKGIFHVDWVPEGQTVNQVYCKSGFETLREQIQRRRLGCGGTTQGSFITTMCRHTPSQSSRTWRSTASLCWSIHLTLLT